MDPKQPNHVDSPAQSSSGKGKEPSRSESTPQPGTAGTLESVASSARNMASALDPRQAASGLVGQLHSLGSSSFHGSSSSSKPTTSAVSTTFQHATNALETIGSSSSSSSSHTAHADSTLGFRGASSTQSAQSGTGAMDWDSFLSSSESNIQDDQPYKLPSIDSFTFSSSNLPGQELAPLPHQQAAARPLDSQEAQFESIYSHPSVQLTPSNHAAFLEYLKSTADGHAQSAPSSTLYTPGSAPSQYIQPPSHQWMQAHPMSVSGGQLVSGDIQRQQHMDGGDVIAFLESTSYSDFVDQVEAAGIDKHQHDRRTFVYSEASLGPQTQSLFSALQLIQHLPSERQDVVQYLLQQGTYADDVWGRPFAHDTEREEAASLAATRAEQDQFIQWAQQQENTTSQGATTQEMEQILRQIVDDAKEEVKTGETNGKALDRLMAVRGRINLARLMHTFWHTSFFTPQPPGPTL